MKIAGFLLFTLLSSLAFGQQFPLNTLFWTNYENINPGASGVLYKHHATAWYRNQWDKVNGAPNTLLAGYNMRSDKLHGGIGINGTYGTIGFNEIWNARVNYSYHLKFGESTLGIGASFGAYTIGTTHSFIPPVTMNDGSLPESTRGELNVGAGLFYQRKNLLIGLSSTEVFQEKSKYNYGNREFWLSGEYAIDLNEDLQLRPSVLVTSDFRQLSITGNLRAVYRNIWAGVALRKIESMGIMAGYDIAGKFRIGYMYEITINALNTTSRGSHEIVLGFMLK